MDGAAGSDSESGVDGASDGAGVDGAGVDGAGAGMDGAGDATAGGDSAEVPPPPPAAPAPLAADELVLSRDPKDAVADNLGWFRDQVKAKLASWGMTFDATAVRMATAGTAPVVALRWNTAWGKRPSTLDLPYSLEPMDIALSVAAVQTLKGWSKVAAGDQSILLNLLGGETSQLSQAARANLRGQFAGISAMSDVNQGKALTGVISAKESMPAVFEEPVLTPKIDFTLDGPVVKKDYQFAGKKADAEEWKAKYKDAVTVPIVAPKAPEAGMHYHTVQETADAAGYLPKAARALITTILLNVQVNPDDAYWATEYKDPNFHSYMTAGAEGIVTIYPDKGELPNANYQRSTFIHETGHTWSYRTWGSDTTKNGWADWKAAMDKDKVSVSAYATASIAEDVAETITAYVSAQGTPQFDEYKKIVPNRFAILARDYK